MIWHALAIFSATGVGVIGFTLLLITRRTPRHRPRRDLFAEEATRAFQAPPIVLNEERTHD